MTTKLLNEKDIKNLKRWGDFQNNTNISLVNNYVYFAVDKVANSTIKQHLFSMEYKPVKKEILSLYDPRCSPLLSPYQIPGSLDNFFNDQSSFKFAFVRNPYTRLLSCYLDRILTLSSRPSRDFRAKLNKEKFEFSDFITFVCKQKPKYQNSHWRNQTADILFDLINFDFIGKFESLSEDLNYVHRQIFDEDFSSDVLNKNFSPNKTSAGDKIAKFYDQELLDMVYESFIKDFENFGYEKIIL